MDHIYSKTNCLLSDYAQNLDSVANQDYLTKLRFVKPNNSVIILDDPYIIVDADWKADMAFWPSVASSDIETYLKKFPGKNSSAQEAFQLVVAGFSFHIENELFGQHIISYYLPKLLNDHIIKNKPMKPLLISFQGPTGSGKSFVSKLIVESLFQEGFKSNFVHTYYGSRDFFHEKQKENYRKRLLHEIPFLSSLCDRPVFIFEEMDKMVPGVLDVLLPFIYFYENSTDVYAADSIFIFISNSGAKRIEEILYDAWLEGVPREDMTLSDFSSCLKAAAYNEPGGLQYSEIIKRNLLNKFLPFLPLEKEHVKQCVLREFNLREIPLNKNTVEFVADQIIYYPPEFELFAEGGCKRVSQKVDLFSDIDL